jgi:hypothetical protein
MAALLALALLPASVLAAPSIVGFTPPDGAPGTLVKIVGRGLDRLESLTFNGVEADFRVVSETHIKAIVPGDATTGPIRAIASDGEAVTGFAFVVRLPGPEGPTRLAAPMPNPSRAEVIWSFTLSRAGAARLVIHDAQGRRVRVLADGLLPAGRHERRWDGRDASGRPAPAGVYVARLEAGSVRLAASCTRLP